MRHRRSTNMGKSSARRVGARSTLKALSQVSATKCCSHGYSPVLHHGRTVADEFSELRARALSRLSNVESLLEQFSGASALSEARKVRYSVVVKTTEAALAADQNATD